MPRARSIMPALRVTILVIAALAVGVAFGPASGRVAETRLSSTPQAYPFTRLGGAVALADGLAIVGAPGAYNGSQDAGAVYLFEQIGAAWLQTATLIAADGTRGDDFGGAVAGGTDTVAVLGDGEVYVFGQSGEGWIQVAQLTSQPATGPAAARFESLALADDLLVAGATDDRTGGRGAGALQVFERTNGVWQRTQKLRAPDGGRNRGFGYRVATDGKTIAAVDRVGALQVFNATAAGWVASDLEGLSSGFVTQVVVAGRWIAAVVRDPQGETGESVLLIRRSRAGWKQVAAQRVDDFDLQPLIVAATDGLAFDGRQVILGQGAAGIVQPAARRDGVVHILRRKGRRLLYDSSLEGQSSPQEFDFPFAFGAAVALAGPLILVGAPGVGSAYVYTDP